MHPVPSQQRALIASPIHPQTQSALLRLPNELLADIFEQLSAVDLARVEQVCCATWYLAQPAWSKVCGPRPLHRAMHPESSYKHIAQEQRHLRQAQAQRDIRHAHRDTQHDLSIMLGLATNTYLQEVAAKCDTFAAASLCALQLHPQRATPIWHHTCAALLMMQQRFDEAQLHIDALPAHRRNMTDNLRLLAVRYGGPHAIAADDWVNLSEHFRHQAFIAAIAGHQKDSIHALMDLDMATPQTQLRYSHAAAVAAKHNNFLAFRLLVANGAQVDGLPPLVDGVHNQSCAPMWEAACYGHIDIISYLISWNIAADRASDGRGQNSPLDVAIVQNHIDVVNALMATLPQRQRAVAHRGLRLANLLSPDRPDTSGRPDMLRALVASWDIPINRADASGRSFLHLAAERGDAELVACALELGADPMKMDHTGQTPLELAINMGHTSVILLLTPHQGARLFHIISYDTKADLVRAVLHPVLAAQEPMLQIFSSHWRQQMAPARLERHAITHPQMTWFIEDMQQLYVRTFSTNTLRNWQAHYSTHPTVVLARQLGDIMRLVRQGSYIPADRIDVLPEVRMQIAAICRTWIVDATTTHPLLIEHRNAFIQTVARNLSRSNRLALLAFARLPFGARLAAGMRHKYDAETRLWNAFGVFPAPTAAPAPL